MTKSIVILAERSRYIQLGGFLGLTHLLGFKDVNHFLVECNYDVDILIDNACDNIHSQSASENHMELNDTIEFLKQNYSSSLQSITLIHLSNGNINAKTAKKRVQDELGFSNVIVADAGVEIELIKEDF